MADAFEPATEIMLTMANVRPGARVLDLACGAGSQSLLAAHRVGAGGHVVASDIAESMLQHVRENARASGLANITTLAGAAEDLDLAAETCDAAICRLGVMLFLDPARALTAVGRALKPGGKVAVMVFTTPTANQFASRPMQVLLRHAGKSPPGPRQPGIFSLGAPGVLERLLTEVRLWRGGAAHAGFLASYAVCHRRVDDDPGGVRCLSSSGRRLPRSRASCCLGGGRKCTQVFRNRHDRLRCRR